MPFNARVFQIFIASPGDVQEEREIATEVIRRWNDLYARERSLVLLPLRWETHSTPELGNWPQAVINRQVLDQCDLLVGIFWTKLGTPTGKSASGTVEEIERAAENGKHVMLYFSNAKANLDSIDLDEYKRLREFKKKTYPEGLVESYSTTTEFRDKFFSQLTRKISDLVTHVEKEKVENTPGRKPDISLAIAPASSFDYCKPNDDEQKSSHFDLRSLITEGKITVELVSCTNQKEIPDFNFGSNDKQDNFYTAITMNRNINYYRELVEFYIIHRRYKPCRITIINNSIMGFANVALQIKIDNPYSYLRVTYQLPERPGRRRIGTDLRTISDFSNHRSVLQIEDRQDHWEMVMDVSVIQAKRTIIPENRFFLSASASCPLQLETTIYSTTSPPFVVLNMFQIEVLEQSMTYQEILAELGEKVEG